MSWLQHQDIASQAGLDKFLFGRAAALVEDDVVTMAAISLAALLLVGLFWKEFKLLSFDPEYGATLGFPMRRLDVLLTTLIVVAIVVGLQMVGVVLMSAMIVAPGAAARQWTDKMGRMVMLSALFGAVAGVSGALISSLTTGLPTGPMIVLSISGIVVVSLVFAPNRGLYWDWMRQHRNRRLLRASRVLESLYVMGSHHGDPQHAHSLRSLQAVMPGHDVEYTLNQLVADGLVARDDADTWMLTAPGVAEVEKLLNVTGSHLEFKKEAAR